MTNSVDVAKYFGKRHDNVLADIDQLCTHVPDGGLLNFKETPYVHPQNGQTYRAFDMTRDGFVLLAFGFTGKKAFQFKLDYIAEFNAMEAGHFVEIHNAGNSGIMNKNSNNAYTYTKVSQPIDGIGTPPLGLSRQETVSPKLDRHSGACEIKASTS